LEGQKIKPAKPGKRVYKTEVAGVYSRARMHWWHQMNPGLSGRRDYRRPEINAYDDCRAMHGLRTLHSTLPDGLH